MGMALTCVDVNRKVGRNPYFYPETIVGVEKTGFATRVHFLTEQTTTTTKTFQTKRYWSLKANKDYICIKALAKFRVDWIR